MKAVLLAAVALVLMPAGAEAQSEERPNWRSVRQKQWICRDWGGCGYEWRWRRVRIVYPNHTYRLIDEHAYRAPERENPRIKCDYDRPPVRATGDDKLDERGAEISAQDRWALEVETSRGTIKSDIRFAADVRIACVRKAPSTATEKGQANFGVRHHVCTATATPCQAPNELKEEEDRAKRRLNDPDPPARIERYAPEPEPKRRWRWRRD